jgi:hypothetical protein
MKPESNMRRDILSDVQTIGHESSELKIRRRRWLISAQGWSASDNLGFVTQHELSPARVRQSPNPFQGSTISFGLTPGFSQARTLML